MRSVAKNNHLKTKQAIDMNTITSKIITMLLLLFALSACGSDKKQKAENQQVSEEDLPFVDPSMVAEDFFLSIYLGDKMGVKQHCTNQVWDYIRDKKFMEGVNGVAAFAADFHETFQTNETIDISNAVSVSDQIIEGNLARVDCTLKATLNPETITLFMIIKDGEWIIEDMSQFIPVDGDRIL